MASTVLARLNNSDFGPLSSIMKLALYLLLLGRGDAFVSRPQLASKTATPLNAHKNEWFAPVAVAVAGWAMAAQLSFATPAETATMLPGKLSFLMHNDQAH